MSPIRSVALLALVLAACQQPNDENIIIDESNAANAEIETLPPDETVTNETTNVMNGNSSETAPLAIPAAFHGRWGMTPADCTSTRGDAKGLITIDGKSIKFYESRGTLTKVTLNAPENFTGAFAFTGEGQNWTNSQNLKLTDSSNTLIRSETDVAQSYSYNRCR